MLTKMQNRIGLLVTVSLIAFALFAGCSSKSTLDTTPPITDAAVSVAASPTSIETSETSVVEATVTVAAVGVADQVVQFSVSPAGAGTVTPEYDTTDADGIAATVFTAVQSGAVLVTASVVGEGISDNINIQVAEGGTGGTGNLTISATQTLLVADGHDTSAVTVAVRDELGQPAPDGTLVKFVAGERFVDVDGNGYWSENIDSLVFDANGNDQWDSYGLIPSTATITGGAGQVVVNYVSGQEAYTVYIKASVDEGGIVGFAELSVQVSPNAVLHSIYMASDSLSLSVQSTGGIETSTLRATGYDIYGNLVPEGQPIYFAILDGPGGGEHLDTLDVSGIDTALTNRQGTATTVLSSGTVSGTVRVRAFQGTILSNATQILIAAGPPEHMVVGVEVPNAPLWNIVGDSLDVVAVVGDMYNNPVNDSTVVYFTTDEGTIMSHQSRTFDGKGIATSSWISGTIQPPADGIVWVYAETSGGTVQCSTFFYNSHRAAVLTVTGWQNTIPADGSSKFSPEVHAVDLNGNPVVGGTTFEARANYLTVTGGIFEDGYYSAKDMVDVTSVVLEEDFSTTGANDDGIGATDTVTYWSGGGSITNFCVLLTGFAYSANSEINGETTAIPGEQVRLSAVIADRYGNPLADHTLNMTASGGVVTGGTQETNNYGEATGFIWTAPAGEADYNITVTDTDPRGGGMVLTLTITVKAAT